MNPIPKPTLKQVFNDILEAAPPDRAKMLARLGSDDPALRVRVEHLLTANDRAGAFLTAPTANPDNADDDSAAAQEMRVGSASVISMSAGTQVGPYRLLERLGEGGFGEVWAAEQTQPIRRKLALKILKAGMDTKEVLARFAAERQALAMMDHQHIARVYDAGATDAGRPYFVMELVAGLPITDFCDAARLPIRRRLELFIRVCEAVQHAHSKGIIHRDLKPSNILVTPANGNSSASGLTDKRASASHRSAVPKVIDFGIAKATHTPFTDRTLLTEAGRLMGTPEYMSPEQAGSGGVDVDTRSDIYSLGVILYQLLTGTLPFEPKALREAGYDGLVKIIREMEPPRPSTRLSTMGSEPVNQRDGATPQEIAARRDIDYAALQRQVRGELDWIVMKCLEKDRSRRYATANGLALELERHLNDEPVLAGPPSRTYRLRKLIHRNRGSVIAAVLVAGALLTGFSAAVWQAVRAQREADRAERQWQLAEERANETRQVSDFQARMLSQIDSNDAGVKLLGDIRARFEEALVESGVPQDERAARLAAFASELARVNATDTAAEMIDRTILKPALAVIEQDFTDQPIVDASLRHTLAELYHRIGKYDEAWPLLDRALATRRRVLGEEHPDTLVSIQYMGTLLLSQGKYEQAEPLIREVLEKRQRLLGADDAGTLQSITNMGTLLFSQGKVEEAEPYYREALDKRRRLLGDEHADTLESINSMGMLLEEKGEFDQAEPYFREMLEKSRRALGDDHMHTLGAIINLGGLLRAQGKFEQAEPHLREALESCRRVLGDEHPRSLHALNNLGGLFFYWGKLDQAEPYWREALAKRRRVLGEEHPDTLTSISNLGSLLQAQGKLEQAEPYLREALEKFRRMLGEEHPNTLVMTANMGSLLSDQGKYEQAEPYHREALEKFRSLLGEDHPNTISLTLNMGGLLSSQDKLAEAETYYREAMEKCRRVLGEEHPTTLKSIDGMGLVLRKQGKLDQAEPFHREALEKYRRVLGEENPDTLISTVNMVSLLQEQGNFAEAEALLVTAAEVAETKLPPRHRARGMMLKALAKLYDAWDKAEPGQGYDDKAAEWRTRLKASKRPKSGADDGG